ncbi:MAG: hypothetical protein ACJ72P_16060, partial [Nocardioides sp.]
MAPLLSLTAGFTSPAAALDAPSSLSPNGPVSTATPTLEWNRVNGAAKYELEMDNNSDFGSPFFSLSTTNDKAVPTVRLPADDVFWRVRAVSATGAQSIWAMSDLVVDRTAAPTPSSPIGGEQLSQPSDPALLRWSAVRGAIRYHIEVDGDTDPDWVGATTYTSPGPAFQIPTPQAPRVWHWRVRAETAAGMYTEWSDGASYEILPLADVQQDPSMETGGPIQDVVLKWLPVPGAAKYELEVGLDRDFNQPVETRTVLSTRYSPTTTYVNDQFFWRVRAIDAGNNQMAWPATPFSFQRSWPQRPELLHPADQLSPAAGDDFYYQWTPVRHATRYQLDVGNDPNFSPNSFDSCQTASTTFTAGYLGADPCMPAQGSVTYWRVRALDAPHSPAVEGIYSEIHRFVYDSGRVNLLAPADGAAVTVPTLKWGAGRDAEKYRVELKNAAGTLVGGTPVTTHSLSWTPSSALDSTQGPFTWTVQAVDYGGSQSPKYGGRTFTLAGMPPITGAPALTPAPVAPGTRFPSLSWEPYPNVKHYRIRIGINGSGFWDDTATSPILTTSFAYPAATDIGDRYLSPDTYMWQVQAVDQNNVASGWGPTGTFTVQDLPAVTGQRIALDGQALDAGTTCDMALGTVVEEAQICTSVPATPVLDWNPVPGAGGYLVYVSNDRELTNRVYTEMPTANSRWTPTSGMNVEAFADNQAGESYYWYVRPCKTINPVKRCGPDPISTNAAATNAFRKISPEVELLAPGANSVNECTDTTTLDGANCAGDIAFSWVDYHTTNQAVSYAGGLAPSYQTGQKYRIEIARNAQFSPILHSREVDQPTYTWFDDTLPEGDLWWRVQAIDAKNNRLAWSDAAKVTKDSGGVGLISPIGNVSVPGSTPFAWTPKTHAASYKIEVYKNDDANYSPANLLFYADNLKLSSYVHNNYLPTSTTPYRWRVRWTDAGGELGPWTSGGRFRVEPDQVGLVSPTAGSHESPNGPLFTWNSALSAVKYTVEVRRVGATSSAIRQTTAATAWATTNPLADGDYEWRVTAYDTSNGSLGSSVWRRFSVDTTRPTVIKASPVTQAKRTSNFVATFSEPVVGVSSKSMRLYVAGRTTPLSAV